MTVSFRVSQSARESFASAPGRPNPGSARTFPWPTITGRGRGVRYSVLMARYEIELADETVVEADDARFVAGGRFVEFIPRKAGKVGDGAERVVLNAELVRGIHFKAIGFKGGWRFDGERDSSFERSDGSI